MAYAKKGMGKNLRKAFIAGIVMAFLDFIAHSTIGNPETAYYFMAKPIIAGYVAYIYYKFKFKIPIWAGIIFAAIHGAYYRLLELIYGKPLFSRVGDVVVGSIIFKADTIWQGIIAWLVIHAGSFIAGIFVADRLIKK